ncbi:MAG TPA: choice-of-anchor tandem repeat GloVer-containing protein, partial [Parafilimonas sp.]|nr:choice-of-anchor tandem repeat GloVer-containing protein [Parafilimonas sp.]
LKGSLLLASDSNFYGMTSAGGSNGSGTIFKITPAGNFTVLKNLQNTTDGSAPLGSLIQAKDGYLYGMTSAGGTYAGGTIFKISTTGTFTVLKHFSPNTDGGYPEGDLVEGSDGFLYGMNKTRIFKISTAGAYTVLRTLNAGTDGSNPLGNLVVGTDGNFYGMASGGGKYNAGTIFKITPAGNFTTLTNLHPDTTGSVPKGSLVVGSDGNFYGMTSAGGSLKAGTIFKVTPAGNVTVLRNLSLTTDGGSAFGSLIVQKNLVLVANAQSMTTNEDTAKVITLTGSGASPLVYTIITPPKKGKLTGTAPNITYKPNANFYGKDSFYFTVTYGCVSSAPAKVSIKINSINDAPVLAPIGDKSVVVNNNLSFTATATDVDKGSVLTYSLIGAPAGAGIGATSGVFSWTPTAQGSFTFTVRVTDNGVPSLYDEEKITVTVTQGFNAMIEGLPQTHATIFPNPVRDRFKVSMPQQTGNLVLQIVGAAGNIITTNKYNGANNVIEVDASKLAAGAYVLIIETELGKESLKFIKL